MRRNFKLHSRIFKGISKKCPKHDSTFLNLYWVKATQYFVLWVVRRSFLGQLVGKITILSFRVGMSKNKNIDHQVKETFAIISTQVTYEINHISLLCDSVMSHTSNFCFLSILL